MLLHLFTYQFKFVELFTFNLSEKVSLYKNRHRENRCTCELFYAYRPMGGFLH